MLTYVNSPFLVKSGQRNWYCVWGPTYICLILSFTIGYPLLDIKEIFHIKKTRFNQLVLLQTKNKTQFIRGQDVRNLSLSSPKCRFHIFQHNMSQWTQSIHTVNDLKCDLTLSDLQNFISKQYKNYPKLNSSCPNWSDFMCCFEFTDWSRSIWILPKHGSLRNRSESWF